MRRIFQSLLLTSALIGAAHAKEPIAAAYDAQRCVNLGNAFETPRGESWGGRDTNMADLDRIKAAGFDTVRVPVRWDDYAANDAPFAIEESFFKQVEKVVYGALERDLNVILNIHHYEELMEEPRANARKFIELWRQIATRFADAPDSLWFETLNEPTGNMKGELMRGFQSASISAIRESNPDRIVIIMGENWSSVRSLPSNIEAPDNNIVYSFHYYDPFDFTHQKASWLGDAMPKGTRGWGSAADRKQLAADADLAASKARETGHPVYLGEFGAHSPIKQSERRKYVEAVRTEMEKRDIAWCLWSYSNTFSLYTDRDGWDEPMLEALGLSAGD